MDGYVAYVDLLGFTQKSRIGDFGEFFDRYDSALATALETGPRYVVFSDSIVLYTDGDGVEELVAMVQACARLYYQLLKIEASPRGAIAWGPYSELRKGHGIVVAGRPLVEAVDYERRQNWLGIMLCPSVLLRNPHIRKNDPINLRPSFDPPTQPAEKAATGPFVLRHTNIPFHDVGHTSLYDGCAVLPNPLRHLDRKEAVRSLQEAEDLLVRLHSIAPDPAAQWKIEQARAFVRGARDSMPELG